MWTLLLYSRLCFLGSPLGAAKASLKGRWSVKWGLLRHADAKSTLFSPWNGGRRHVLNSHKHFQLYTLISYIFAVQSLCKRWFQACTRLQQGTCVLYCGPILWYIYSRNCLLWTPLGAAKINIKRQVVCETRVAKTCPCQANTFLFLKKRKGKAFFQQSQHTCNCIHWYLTSFLFELYTIDGSKLTQAYNKVHVYSAVVPYTGTFTCKWFCVCKFWWSLVMLGR